MVTSHCLFSIPPQHDFHTLINTSPSNNQLAAINNELTQIYVMKKNTLSPI